MKTRYVSPLSLLLLSLCLSIGFVIETRAQETPPRPQEPMPEFRLRDGTVIKAYLSMDANSGYVELSDELGHKRKVERHGISLICFSDCKGASHQNRLQDLVVMKDGRRQFGEIGWTQRTS